MTSSEKKNIKIWLDLEKDLPESLRWQFHQLQPTLRFIEKLKGLNKAFRAQIFHPSTFWKRETLVIWSKEKEKLVG
jgi:hypothetical protein